MRQLTDAARLREFMRLLGRRTRAAGRVYLVGGACAVLHEWRATTIDIQPPQALAITSRHIARRADHPIAFAKQKVCEVRAVLAGDSSHQSNLLFIHQRSPKSERLANRVAAQ